MLKTKNTATKALVVAPIKEIQIPSDNLQGHWKGVDIILTKPSCQSMRVNHLSKARCQDKAGPIIPPTPKVLLSSFLGKRIIINQQYIHISDAIIQTKSINIMKLQS